MEKVHGLRRPVCLSRFGRAASVSVDPPSPHTLADPQRPTDADIARILREDRASAVKKPPPPSAAFLSVSRAKAQEVAKYKTISPDVGRYEPNYNVGKGRTDYSPVYKEVRTSPRAQRIFLPPCLSHIQESYPRHDRTVILNETFDPTNKRTISDLRSYSRTIAAKDSGDMHSKPPAKLKGAVVLTQQLDRPEFVSPDGPPSPQRFHFKRTDSWVLSTTRRLPDISFAKCPRRPELFHPKPLPDYRPNTRLIRRSGPKALSFSSRPGRKTLALDYLLRNPPQVDQQLIDKGWSQLKTSPVKAPRLKSLSPRDDLMYRTNEQYKQNVPKRQLAMDVPIYQGEFKDAFKGSKTATSINVYL